MLNCGRRTQGGKGNVGMFIERDSKIRAAGKATAQPTETVANSLRFYILQDEVDALVHDAIIPALKEYTSEKPRKHRDMRNAGIFSEGRDLINPPQKTKFHGLVEDLKSTVYSSYWKNPVGTLPDLTPLLPRGLNIQTTTMGDKPKVCERINDVIMPKHPVPEKSSPLKRSGYQTVRNYCRPAYNPNNIFGIKYNADKRGTYAKCCITDDRVTLGTSRVTGLGALEADFKETNDAHLALCKSPNDNISCVPAGYAFGKLKTPSGHVLECLTTCELNTGKYFYFQCLRHLNTLRKCLSKRINPTFYREFYLRLKYLDKTESGWLPKQVVYDFCVTEHIRFNPSLIEPLLETWNAYDGSQIKYKTFVRVINYRVPSPDLPKIQLVSAECNEFSTAYTDMVKFGKESDTRLRAGLPSGRYFDMDYPRTPIGYCKADRVFLSEESDVRVCLNPSNLTHNGVSHRDMYAKRSREVIRKVFEAAGEPFTDEKFNEIWDEAKQYHSEGWVSYETFKKALYKNKDKHITNK